MSQIVDKIFEQFPHDTPNAQPEHVKTILESIEQTKDIPGAVVELGCHAGLTSIYIRRLLDRLGSDKEFHVYDSFQGLPDKDTKDGDEDPNFCKGYFNLGGTWQLLKRFNDANLRLPKIHEGWFKDQTYPDKISFGFLDGDFYQSILDSLEKVWPRLQPGGIICIHDYGWDKLPGVEQAVREYFGSTDMVTVSTFGLAVIQKK